MLTKYNAGSAAGTQSRPRLRRTREFSFPSPGQGMSIGDGTMVHAVTTFDQQNRRVIVGLTGGTCGDWYAAYAFNPGAVTSATGVEAFEPLSLTTGDFPGGFHQGEFVHADWGVYDPYHNEHVYLGGKVSGNAAAYSPTWVPASGPYVLTGTSPTDGNLPYAYDDAQSVWNPATGTMYTRGTHYTQTDSGGTITWTNIGGMAPSVVILLRVPRASEFARFRYSGVGTAPVSTQPSITALSPSSAVMGGPGFTLIVTGSNFTADAVVLWDGAPRATVFDSSTQLRATIPGADVAAVGLVHVTVTESTGTSTARDFTVLYPPTTLSLVYEGQIRDRVGQGDGALGPDGAMDGVVAVTIFATGGRIITAIKMKPTPLDEWNTTVGDGKWLLGVALTRDGALINNPVTMAVGFTVADSATFYLFGSDASTPTFFVLGTTLTVTVTMSDGSTATQAVTIGTGGTAYVRTAGPETLALTDGPLTRVVLPPTSKPTVEIDLTQPPGLHASIRRIS
jgi:hypothetical protein